MMDFIIRNPLTGTFKFFTISSYDEIDTILQYYKATRPQLPSLRATHVHCTLEWTHRFDKEESNDTYTNT